MTPRVLVAGIGNIFLTDDGFGPEVARRLAAEPVPEGVRVRDFGIRGVHLAYELLDGYDVAILIDAMPSGDPAGTISVLEPSLPPPGSSQRDSLAVPMLDAHDMAPETVLNLVDGLGGRVGKVLVVGCQPADAGEGMGLTAPVAAAVEDAVAVVRDLIHQEVAVLSGKGQQP